MIRALRKVIGCEKGCNDRRFEKITYEELHNLSSLSTTIRIIKSRRKKWEGRVAYMGRSGMHLEL
jgi:hypothetical protein